MVSEPQSQVEEAREGRGAGPPVRPAVSRPPGGRPPSQPLPGGRALPSPPPPCPRVCMDSSRSCSRCLPGPGPSTTQRRCSAPGHPARLGHFPGHGRHVSSPCLHRTHLRQVSCNHAQTFIPVLCNYQSPHSSLYFTINDYNFIVRHMYG